MQHKKFVACAAAALMAVALGCSNDSPTPVSPSGAEAGASGAGPAGETLKATAPTPQSPDQQSAARLAGARRGQVESPRSRRARRLWVRVRDSQQRRYGDRLPVDHGRRRQRIVGPGIAATARLEFDQPYTWRVRALFAGNGNGPWSVERDVPRARRRLHPRQRNDGSADQRQDRRTILGSDRSSFRSGHPPRRPRQLRDLSAAGDTCRKARSR